MGVAQCTPAPASGSLGQDRRLWEGILTPGDPLLMARLTVFFAPLLLFRFRQFLYRNPILIGPTNIRGLVLAPLSRPVFRMIEI